MIFSFSLKVVKFVIFGSDAILFQVITVIDNLFFGKKKHIQKKLSVFRISRNKMRK